MHRRVTRELCISRNGNLKSPASMRFFLGFSAGSLRFGWKGSQCTGCANCCLIRMNPAGQPRAAVATPIRDRPRFLPRYLRRQIAFPTIPGEKGVCAMPIYDPPPGRGRIIDMQGGSMLRLVGVFIIGLLLVIFLFSAIARVDSGAVGVLTLFGRVTS